MRMGILFSMLLSFATIAWGAPAGEIAAALDSSMVPYFSAGTVKSFRGAHGVILQGEAFEKMGEKPGAERALVILTGRTEPAVKYAELIYDLRNEPASIFIFDHRGQGFSARLLSDRRKGHVERFANYVADLDTFVREVVRPGRFAKVSLFAHSMGGTVALLYMAEHPGTFANAVLSAPMIQINTAPYSESTARVLANGLNLVGLGAVYAPGQPRECAAAAPFAENSVDSSAVRYAMNLRISEKFPDTRVCGATNRWVEESLLATQRLRAFTGKEFSAPLTFFQAEHDVVVVNSAEDAFCAKFAGCSVIRLNSKHETYMSEDSERDQVIARIRRNLAD